MIEVYVYYPTYKITLHSNTECGMIRAQNRPEPRIIRINCETISTELQRFAAHQYPFGSYAGVNDMWLEIHFGDDDFETAVLDHVRCLIGRHYPGLGSAEINHHC